MKRLQQVYIALLLMGLLGGFTQEARGQEALPGIDAIEPKEIQIGSFFHGQNVSVRVIIPHQSDLALRVLGPREDLKLMKKGWVGGLWMNVEQVTFEKIPNVYLLWTSPNLSAMGGKQWLQDLKLDYLTQLSDCLPGKSLEEKKFLIQELIKLKNHDNLYNIFEGTIRNKPLEKGLEIQAEATLHLPAKIYPGVYTLELITFKDGKGTLLRSYPLKVQLSGFPAILFNLATQRGLLYGVLATAIATLSGLLIGIFFSAKGSH